MPVTVPTVPIFDNNDQSAADQQGASVFENARSSRLKAISDALADEANSRNATTAAGVDAAIRGSYANSLQPAAPQNISADPATGGATGGNLTDGQTQVQSIPTVSDAVKPAPSPIGNMQLPQAAPQVNASALSAPPAPAQPASSVPSPPPATAFQTASAAPAPLAPAAPVSAASPGAQSSPAQSPQASPFDSPEFQQNLAAHLSTVPGAGQELMNIKTSRDATIGKVMEMISNGHTDEARFTAQRNGLNIPDQFFTNSDLAAGLSYGQKAYPEDSDRGQAFFMAYTQTQGTTDQKVQAGLAAAGPPTSQAQKELNKALALGRGNYQTPGGGITNLNPLTHVATPYVTPTGDAAKVTAGYGIRPTAGTTPKFQNVGGQLVYTDPVTGSAKVVVPKNSDPTTAITGIMNHIMSAGINVDPEDAKNQAVKIYSDLKANPGGSGISAQTPPSMMPAQVVAPAPDAYDSPYGAAGGRPGSSAANPLNAQTQADIDNAPPGSFINANGSMFRK